MKLASFLYQGKRSYGIVQAEGVIDLGRRLGDRYSVLFLFRAYRKGRAESAVLARSQRRVGVFRGKGSHG